MQGWLIHYRYFDLPDEFEHLHASWSISHGMFPYRDFFEVHPPLLWLLFAPFFRFFHVDTSADSAWAFILFARTLIFLMAGAILVFTFWLGELWRGPRVAAVGTAMLATVFVFQQQTLDIRPDVPAALLILASLIALVSGMQLSGDRSRRIAQSFFLGGATLATALLFTQKSVYILLGLAPAFVWYLLRTDFHGSFRSRLRNAFWFIPGFLLPVVILALYLAARGSLGAFYQYVVVLPLHWPRVPHSRWPQLQWFGQENLVYAILAAIGSLRLFRSVAHGEGFRRGDVILLFSALSLLVGLLLNPAGYFEYYPLFLPLFALIGASLVVDATENLLGRLQGRLGPRIGWALTAIGGLTLAGIGYAAIYAHWPPATPTNSGLSWGLSGRELAFSTAAALLAIAAGAALRASSQVVVAAVLVALTIVPLYREIAWGHHSNDSQVAQVRYVIDNSAPMDTVLDGCNAIGLFRPQAFKYGFFIPNDVSDVIPRSERAVMLDILRVDLVLPKFVVLDYCLEAFLGPVYTRFIEHHYTYTGVGVIWVRRS
jgi:hypothetical protein